EGLSNPSSPYRGYYFFTDKPNNWTSFFSGGAWNEYSGGLYALHLFSKKQMDLNWENPAMRQELYAMVRRWLERGVDGFRLDVINYISKAQGLPDGNVFIGDLMEFRGIEHYFHGPRLHEYLRELRREAFAPYDAFSVGETPGIGQEVGRLLTHPDRGELDMMFSFDHLETPGHVRFDEYEYDLNYYKSYIIDWQRNYGADCWMSLFWDNHDNPRMLSKVDHSHRYKTELAKLLGLIQLTLRGTPFLYQGQELGLGNHPFTDISQLRDVESINKYNALCETMPPDAAFRRVAAGSREHARVPINWSLAEDNEILAFYKDAVSLRKEMVYEPIEFFHEKKRDLLVYRRGGYLVVCNLSRGEIAAPKEASGAPVLSNYAEAPGILRPYEGRVYS
ncbi:MAG: alpha-glucosidase, partial [Clostridiales bacterium]|nr:alpha-glucosidase [Clostridiales bacterium]